MKVVLNSDIIYATYRLTNELTAQLRGLCSACVEKNISIVIPETTLLEFKNGQRKHADAERRALGAAFERLNRFGVRYEYQDPSNLILTPDLIQLLQRTGATVEVTAPTDEELREAHRRACLHEPPVSGETKGNEMRDVVIWLVALRTARESGAALLLSADSVHNSERGKAEATAAGLRRAASIEAGMELLELISPAAELARALLEQAWRDLVDAGLPVQLPVKVTSVGEATFIQGTRGVDAASFKLRGLTGSGETLKADVTVDTINGRQRIDLKGVYVDDQLQEDVSVEITAPGRSDEYEERLSSLRGILGA